MDEEAKGPDDKGIWTVKGTYVTEEGGKAQFTASVTLRGEVTMITPVSNDLGARQVKPTKRDQPIPLTDSLGIYTRGRRVLMAILLQGRLNEVKKWLENCRRCT